MRSLDDLKWMLENAVSNATEKMTHQEIKEFVEKVLSETLETEKDKS